MEVEEAEKVDDLYTATRNNAEKVDEVSGGASSSKDGATKPNAEEDEEEIDEEVEFRIKQTAKHKNPTAAEIARHELAHMPYRAWCPLCVKCKLP